ncbi:U1 small nuclear ribonucleoprotein C-like [Cyprinus carpio]|uniref:U1 small nuclear ribonucleoprotein C-like n=1 Tax=Cyprinus carpio TaxID=7962 RepID=A0A9Q9YWR8_CYPCA|nr:U1 small nuclear ribonucleoprotein C-like [Cyprinus carpio]
MRHQNSKSVNKPVILPHTTVVENAGSPTTGAPTRRPRHGPGPQLYLQVPGLLERALLGGGEGWTSHIPAETAGTAADGATLSHQPPEEVGGDPGPSSCPEPHRTRGCGCKPPSLSGPEDGAAAPGQSVPGCVLLPARADNVLQHDIRTPPGVVVRQRPYHVPEARRQAIEEEVQQMLKLGVIEPSRSPWFSPIVMVPKPDGTLRFCNDFRRLNEVSEFDGYPMPRVDELLPA